MRRISAAVFLFVGLMAGSAEAETFRWSRTIELPPVAAQSVLAVPLDLHFYEHTTPGWPDVRLTNAQGEAQGFEITAASETRTRLERSFWPAEQRGASVQKEGRRLVVGFSLRPDDPVPQGIRVITPLRDFEQSVLVEATSDGMTWRPASSPTSLYDYSRYVDAREELVRIDAGTDRQFRLVIDEPTSAQASRLVQVQRTFQQAREVEVREQTTVDRQPFRIDRLEFFREQTRTEAGQQQLVVYPADWRALPEVETGRTTLLVSAQRQPLTQLTLQTSSENFSRPAQLEVEEGSGSNRHFRKLVSGRLTHLSVGTIRKDELTLRFPQTSAQSFRLTIENSQNSPVAISGIELAGPKYELLALAVPGATYELQYGGPALKGANYDHTALDAALSQPLPTVSGRLGPIREGAAAPVAAEYLWNDVRVVVIVMLILVAILALLLYQASVRINAPPAE